MSTIYHLLYASRATVAITNELIRELIQKSVASNKEHDITGFLIARQDYFLQLLEGPEENVKKIYARIENDPRHTAIRQIASMSSARRIIPSWHMGLVAWDESMPKSLAILDNFSVPQEEAATIDRDHYMKILHQFARRAKLMTA